MDPEEKFDAGENVTVAEPVLDPAPLPLSVPVSAIFYAFAYRLTTTDVFVLIPDATGRT